MLKVEFQSRQINRLGRAHQDVFLLRDFSRQKQREGGGNERRRENHRTRQRQDNGVSHRMKHFALHSAQREDWQIDDHDDERAEEAGADNFLGGVADDLEAFRARQQAFQFVLFVAESPDAVLHDDNRAIHDEAEVERSEAHQVAADFRADHSRDGEQHGKRNDERRDKRGAQIAEQEKQNRHHQHRAFKEINLHRLDGRVDEIGAVIDGAGDDSLWQRLVDLRHLRVDALGNRAAVFADEHEDRSQHGFASVLRRRAVAEFFAEENIRDIIHVDGNAIAIADDDFLNVRNARDLAGAADEILLTVPFDVTRADAGVVVGQRRHQIAEGQAVGAQLVGMRRDVILLHETTYGIYIDDAGHVSQLRLDDPILHGAQFSGRDFSAVGIACARFGFDIEHVDFPEAGGDRAG